MIFYNRKLFKKAGLDPKNPPLATYDEFLATSRKLVSSKAADAAIWPSPESQFFQSWFDFYPLFIAESGGKATMEDGKAQFADEAGQKVAAFWRTMYEERLSPNEKFNGDAFGEQKAAMSIVGPWAIAVYGKDIDWGAAPVPTSAGKPAGEIQTFSDEKSTAMYSACKNRGTAWEFLKFATSKEQDGALLDATGQMPMRPDLVTDLPGLLREEPGLQAVRRAGRPHRRGAERVELDRDLAVPARRLLALGHLRQGGPEGGARGRRQEGRRAGREGVT